MIQLSKIIILKNGSFEETQTTTKHVSQSLYKVMANDDCDWTKCLCHIISQCSSKDANFTQRELADIPECS